MKLSQPVSPDHQPAPSGASQRLPYRLLVALVLLLYAGLLLHALRGDAGAGERWQSTWTSLHIQPTKGGFGDSRNLPAAAAALHAGQDPYTVQADSPYPPFNYPRVWLVLANALHLRAHFLAFALTMVSCFLLAATVSIARASTLRGALLAAIATCSPAALLAVERGNVDLLVFALCYAAVAVCKPVRTSLLLGLATVLKLYPAVALLFWTALCRRAKMFALALFALAAYLVFERNDLRGIRRNTPTPGHYAYGTGALAHGLAKGLSRAVPARPWVAPAGTFCIEALFLVLGAACVLWGRRYASRDAQVEPHALPMREVLSFLLFVSLFLGTFLAGANYVYRLIFLLPTVPFLASGPVWQRLKGVAAFTLALLLLSMLSAPGGPGAVETLSFLSRSLLFFPMAFFAGFALSLWLRETLPAAEAFALSRVPGAPRVRIMGE